MPVLAALADSAYLIAPHAVEADDTDLDPRRPEESNMRSVERIVSLARCDFSRYATQLKDGQRFRLLC